MLRRPAAPVRRCAESPTADARTKIGRVFAHLATLRRMSLAIAAALDRGLRPNVEAAMVKDLGTTLEREIPEMEQKEAIILRVKPGITGIWQVTERNASTFERRLHMDVEYVRSWSPWLDIYVLARTVPVVLGGTGS